MVNQKLDEKHFALTVGSFSAAMHAVWAVAVALGYAPGLLSWIKALHFVTGGITVGGAFILTTAVLLIVVGFLMGTMLGWLFAAIWNKLLAQKWAK